MRRFAAFLVVALCAVALAGTALPTGGYICTSPSGGFAGTASAAPPPTFTTGGRTFTFDPNDGLYRAPEPSGDTLSFTGADAGTFQFIDYPEPPLAGPPTTINGAYSPDPNW